MTRVFVAFFILLASVLSAEEVTFYAGTIGSPTGNPDIAPSEGIYLMSLDTTDGTLKVLGLAGAAKSPNFLARHPMLDGVYYCVADKEDPKSREGLIIAWKRNADGTLARLNTLASGGTCPTHLSVSACGKFLMVANYCSGDVAFLALNPDGSLKELNSVFHLEGSGPNRARQAEPHAHFVRMDCQGKRALCCDLGSDRIWSYVFDKVSGKWAVNPAFPCATVASGAGPRHLTFAPNGRYVYVLNELACTLEAFAYDPETGAMTSVQTSPTLPPGYRGINKAAAIDIHPSGKFLYVSNRGANLITVFALDPTPVDGTITESGNVMTPIQYISSGGDAPRFIGLDPTGKFLLSCNKKTHNMVVYRVDPTTGKLVETGKSAIVPWCVSNVF